MTDDEYRKTKEKIQKVWDKWFKPLGLGWYRVDVEWSQYQNEDNPRTKAQTSSNWQYHTARIIFYVPEFLDDDQEDIENTVVHEMSHILCAPIQDFRDDQSREITEHTVTTVAQALQWAREVGKKD